MIRTVIVEDEVAGQQIIKHYMEKNGLECEVLAMLDNVNDAVEFLTENQVDLVLLDIQIKQGTGFDVLERLAKRDFEIIFITAYDQYAIKAIKHHAFDYMLKPLGETEFVNTIKNITDKIRAARPKPTYTSHVIITRNGRIEKINTSEIIFFEADGAYTSIQTLKEKIYTSKNLGEYASILPESVFVRSHHSYLVNLDHVLSIEKKRSGVLELTNGFKVPVSQRKIADFVQYFKNREK